DSIRQAGIYRFSRIAVSAWPCSTVSLSKLTSCRLALACPSGSILVGRDNSLSKGVATNKCCFRIAQPLSEPCLYKTRTPGCPSQSSRFQDRAEETASGPWASDLNAGSGQLMSRKRKRRGTHGSSESGK